MGKSLHVEFKRCIYVRFSHFLPMEIILIGLKLVQTCVVNGFSGVDYDGN